MEGEAVTPTLYAVHLNGEAPRIGTGRRLVWAEVGRIWVRLERVAP